MDFEFLRSASICLLGYGANHKGLARMLCENDISYTVRDRDASKRMAFEAEFPQYKNLVTWEITDKILKGIEKYGIVFRSPSIPALSPEFKKAAAKGTKIYSQTKLFFDLCPAKIIGVTGTKGKGTTSTLIYNVLRDGWKGGKVFLGGNIGLDPFEFYGKLISSDLVVMELSSFQLQDLHKSPHVAVMLTVTADHLDHHKTVDEYASAKESLLKFQKHEDFALINIEQPHMMRYAALTPALTYQFSRHQPQRHSAWSLNEGGKETVFVQTGDNIDSFDSSSRKLLGDHNLDNILPAVLVGRLFGVSIESIQAAVVSFAGLEHRLSWVGSFNDVDFYDDSIATTPESAEVALASFPSKRIHLIVGGKDKGGSYDDLAKAIAERCVTVSYLPGSATEILAKALKKNVSAHGSLTVLDGARQPLFPTILSGIQPHLKAGDVVLLSPAGSSFESFKDAKERGDMFVKAVKQRYAQRGEL